ncbi:DDHD domain-containing protein [Cantharellus anzutake]|uniref:DDHD domain-containing protein n=1 Tax=Cantharellus anzutake TaxID=1750568 RepID=UPI001903CAF0|nr:DDHD domain-containing protein [Cantharellus anzutake]KAF8334747.1 DDHD domain-containing protein [Cantharellus anzutake]
MSIKPWLPFYQDELRTAHELGPEGREKLRHPIEGTQYTLVFNNAGSAQLISTSHTTHGLASMFSGTKDFGPTTVYRGCDEVAIHAVRDPPVKDSSLELYQNGPKVPSPLPEHCHQGPIITNRKRVVSNKMEENVHEVTDLILIVHGIGQGLTAQYESFNFVYATNMFRNVARKQSVSPALASIVRSKRVQFLPVQWRASMKYDLDKKGSKDGLDNEFTLSEITPKGSIPFIRELTNGVLTDIPLYMSHHRERMIESVCYQANRTYRLWCARNPNFEKQGRVHLVAHSLGTALVAHILSNQPTIVPPLSTVPPKQAMREMEHFLFNTSTVFNLGSPLPVFLRIHDTQLIARKGRERTMYSPNDEALDRVGFFGCLATDSIYNIFNPADPVAYLMNPCVDSERARELPPSSIPNVNTPVLAPLRSRMSRLFDFSGGSRRKSAGSPSGASPLERSTMHQGMQVGIELPDSGSEAKVLEGDRAERRFKALNSHGTLDYYLPGEGNLSEYVDMITAHSSYWNDPSLAAFILSEIFVKKVDLLRTGIGADELPYSSY